MPKNAQALPCVHCLVPTTQRSGKHHKPAHINCTMRKTADRLKQLHEHSGPKYDEWLIQQGKAVNKLLAERVQHQTTPPSDNT